MRMLTRFAAICAALVISGAASAQKYPDKNVKIIVPFAAGGPTDVVARLVAHELSTKFGHQFYIENIPGAGGNTGMAQVARAPADGYTLLFASSSIVVNPSLYKNVPYNFDKDFAPVTKVGGAPNALIVNPSLKLKSVQDLVDLLKKNPGKYTFASPGMGTTPSLSVELFRQEFKLDYAVTQFKGGGPAIQSVLGGHTPMSYQAIPPATALIKEGKLQALAVTSTKRISAFPDVPTLNELGIKGHEAETMQGLFAPGGTPKAVVDALQREVAVIVKKPDIREKLLALGVEPDGMDPQAFAKYCADEIAKWKKVIEDAKIEKI